MKDQTNLVFVLFPDPKEKKLLEKKDVRRVLVEDARRRISWLRKKRKGRGKDKKGKGMIEADRGRKSLTHKMAVAKNVFVHYQKTTSHVCVRYPRAFEKLNYPPKVVNCVAVMDVIHEILTKNMSIHHKSIRIMK